MLWSMFEMSQTPSCLPVFPPPTWHTTSNALGIVALGIWSPKDFSWKKWNIVREGWPVKPLGSTILAYRLSPGKQELQPWVNGMEIYQVFLREGGARVRGVFWEKVGGSKRQVKASLHHQMSNWDLCYFPTHRCPFEYLLGSVVPIWS